MAGQIRFESTEAPLQPRALAAVDVEQIRVGLETDALETLWQDALFRGRAAAVQASPESDQVRRALMAEALRLSPSIAPDVYRVATEAAALLGIDAPVELYQAAGAENARLHLVRSPVLLEVQGRLLSLLDDDALRALVGHELGHFLAHGGAGTPGAARVAAQLTLRSPEAPEIQRAAARAHSLGCELTADRIALLVCQDLHATLRLMMICTTGLSGDTLTWDTRAYLGYARELVDGLLRDGEQARGHTHPEHGLRAYALWQFSESDAYHALTGRGAGARPLAEIDAELSRLVGFAPPQGDAAVSLFETPLAELHECALAGAVMVAWADGRMDEAEADAIEAVFAPLVEGWRGLLTLEAAEARFAQTAPVMRAADARHHEALFSVLGHVMAADGEVTEAEVGAVLGIGQALGQLARFTAMLRSTLHTLGIELVPEQVRPAPLAVPVDEGRAALSAFVEGVVRRGHGVATVRRLLRLLGVQQRTPEAVARLKAALAEHGVSASEDLDLVDARATLRLTGPVAPPPPAEGVPPTGLRAALLKALGRLRDKLVSGDGRSPSVRLRRARTGRVFDLHRLEAVRIGQAIRALTAIQAELPATLVTAEDAGRHDEARRCVEALVALDRTARDRADETGANDLYLGHPVLSGVVGEGTAAAYLLRGPLVLVPVDLVRDARGARGFQLSSRADEPPIVNQALIRAVFHKLGYALTDALLDELNALAADPAAGTAGVLARLAEVGLTVAQAPAALGPFAPIDPDADAAVGPLAIHECALLGVFPQSASDLLQDYDALLKALAEPEVDLAETLAAARALLPAGLRAELDAAPTEAPAVEPRPPVVPADPSQRAVVAEARRQTALVVDGPPGTGKSQVIVNLVADALARGERVAVVCEKRAALDVVSQRLEALGLRDALAVVHELHDDRRPLFKQLTDRFAQADPRGFDAEEAAEFSASASRYTAELAERQARLGGTAEGSALTYGQLLLLRDGQAAPDLPAAITEALAGVGDAARARLETIALRLQRLEPVWRIGGPWRGADGARWRLLRVDADLTAAEGALHAGAAAAEALEADLRRLPLPLAALRAGGEALEIAADTLAGWPSDRADALVRCLARLAADPAGGLGPVDETVAAFAEHAPTLVAVGRREDLDPPPDLVPAAETLRQWQPRFWRFVIPAWWRARGVLKAVVARLLPDLGGQGVGLALLETVETRFRASLGWRTLGTQYARLGVAPLPDTADAAAAQVAAWEAAASTARALWALRPALEPIGGWPESWGAGALVAWSERLADRRALLGRDAETTAALRPVRDAFPWLPAHPTSEALHALGGAFREAAPQLMEIDALLVDAPLADALPLLDALAAAAPMATPATWTVTLSRAWAAGRAAALEARDPESLTLGTMADDRRAQQAAQQLARLQRELGEVEVEHIQSQLDRRPLLAEPDREKYARKTPLQATREALLKEVGKSRRLMSLRSFVRRFSTEGLLDLLPAWLLSPETMAVLFPRQPLFDLVVFDEASQCTVEAGFPVLLRARRVVVAGDEHQMPPTAFFQTTDDAENAHDLSADERAVRDVFASESLLTLARGRAAHRRLDWHYRCRHESLIAFSNHAIYEGALRTIPATATPSAPSPLRWITVPDGEYDAGANRPEANRVVALLDTLLTEDPARSLGVVTFNLKQRRAVLDAVDALRVADDAFEARWAAAQALALDARPFVKNLESVQGDERDVIIFSLGHAPQPRIRGGQPTDEFYVPARFGPLGQRGGERRLNVAISRAKSACYVVSSFAPEQLSVASAAHRGPALFKQFIEFAHRVAHGRHAEAARVLDRVRGAARPMRARRPSSLPAEVSLAAQIAFALEQDGVPVDRDVGVSGFGVPVAVFDPADPTRYALAILTDDGGEALEPFERHVHRPKVLQLRGWAVLRVTAATWARRREDVLAEIHAAVPGARGALGRSPWAELGRGVAPTPGTSEMAAPAAAWHAALSASLRPLLAVLDGQGRLRATEAARLVNPRAFRRVVLGLDGLRAEGRLPWDFEVRVEDGVEVLRRR